MITNPDLAVALALYGEAMRIPEGAVIFRPGEASDGIYIVKAGAVCVQLLDGKGCSVWSREVHENAILGLPSAVGGYPHGILAIARHDSDVIFLRSENLADAIERNPVTGSQVVAAISEELSDLRQKIAMLAPNRQH